ncbi:hypothetical protein I6A84_34880 [Frankia sp. CNm7]|uniref:Uncharacterized protein n=1 Tax=Frankia nepalensis TaxID=1836974 RepID=A0A937RQH1_9ACTN|nr:hypothetical protein [Frankia nepalensis]MBL7495130.1 hypothetical protein [Frankia nepalensis]MBL7514564.1 hypothetical protein [Frankia nepalensis]MBL7523134.1 hypothetical protein [Frankia nepalensis]MBL7633049.1 hypothetical protein [Frankia nepalensis]
MSTDGPPAGPSAGDGSPEASAADARRTPQIPIAGPPNRLRRSGGDPAAHRAGTTPDPAGTPARELAYSLAGGAAAALVAVLVLAAVDPSPGRHVRGLLILIAFVGLLAVAWGWARTVWHDPVAARDQGAEHVE